MPFVIFDRSIVTVCGDNFDPEMYKYLITVVHKQYEPFIISVDKPEILIPCIRSMFKDVCVDINKGEYPWYKDLSPFKVHNKIKRIECYD
jgi:hypothetical protein